MQERHRSAARAPHPDDQIGVAPGQWPDQVADPAELVRRIGVRHDDDVSVGRRDPRQERAAVAGTRFRDDASACLPSGRARAIGRAVVDDEDLPPQPRRGQRGERLTDAGTDGVRLVEAWQHDGHADAAVAGRAAARHRAYGGVAHLMSRNRRVSGPSAGAR
jgi:hypothetical protein